MSLPEAADIQQYSEIWDSVVNETTRGLSGERVDVVDTVIVAIAASANFGVKGKSSQALDMRKIVISSNPIFFVLWDEILTNWTE